jgi:disulfide bond formation protein DsbB
MTMNIPSKRVFNIGCFFGCAGMMAYALYAQHQLYLDPCPLCIFQRVAVTGIGIAFLLLAIFNSAPGWVRRIFLGVFGLSALGGVSVAGRHVWLQHLPPDKVPTCGPGLGYMLDNFPLGDALRMVFTGSGECATTDWSFVGLSMPMWVLIAIVAMTLFGFWNNLARD